MLASIRRLPLRQATAAAERFSASRSTSRLFSQITASSSAIQQTYRSLPTYATRTASLLSSTSAQASVARAFTTYFALREQQEGKDVDLEAAVAEGAQEAVETGTPSTQTETPSNQAEKRPERQKDATFASLKGHIAYPTWKALTVKPFGYKDMSLVQEKVLHLLPELAGRLGKDAEPMADGQGRDLLVKAKTGTGKTIAFLVPAVEGRVRSIEDVQRGVFSEGWTKMLERHRPDLDFKSLDKHGRTALVRQFTQNTVGALILSPTRELATQIAMEAKKLLSHHDDLQVQLLVGGASRNHQINDWRRGRPDIIVATPGRLLDLLKDVGMMKEAMSACRTLILDEADTLLEMGFRDELKAIMEFLPPKGERQTMLFSATVSQDIRSIARASLEKNHRFIDCVPAGEDNVHKHIPQYCTVVDSAEEQIPHILRLIAHDQLVNPGKSKVIVFAPTTKLTQMLSDVIRDTRKLLPTGRGAQLYEIHSKKDQNQRFKTSDRFRKDQSGGSVLVTSDVSARGVDYPGTTRVIQVGVPSNKDQYIHRIGRTGRAGAMGRADIVLLNWEQGFLHFQLDDLPIKKLSVAEMTGEVEDLCKKFDESPEDFASPAPQVKDKRELRSKGRYSRDNDFAAGPVRISGPLTGRFDAEAIDVELEASLTAMEPDTVREAFASMLGFYMGRVPELRTTKTSILQGLKQWAVKAGKMEREPFVGDEFLKKLGISSSDRGGGFRGGKGGRFSQSNSDRGGGFRRSSSGGSDRDGGFKRYDRDAGEREGGFKPRSRDGGGGGGFRSREGGSFSSGGREGGFKPREGGGYKGGFSGGRGGSSSGSDRFSNDRREERKPRNDFYD